METQISQVPTGLGNLHEKGFGLTPTKVLRPEPDLIRIE